MATFHRHGDEIKVFIKGAPEVLLKLCQSVVDENKTPVSVQQNEFLTQNEIMASSGLRVLGVAVRTLPAETIQLDGDLFQYIKET